MPFITTKEDSVFLRKFKQFVNILERWVFKRKSQACFDIAMRITRLGMDIQKNILRLLLRRPLIMT